MAAFLSHGMTFIGHNLHAVHGINMPVPGRICSSAANNITIRV
jgi:hypothetical protein